MKKTVADPSAEVAAMQADWDLVGSLLGGTKAMRAAGSKHLPKWPAEDQAAWEARLAVATLFPAYSRTVDTLAGKPFSKPVAIEEDVPPKIREWCDDIDMQGRNLHQFAADVVEDVLGYGLAGVLVEYPRAESVLTRADELARGLRPYWVHIKCNQILGWKVQRVGDRWRFLQLRLMESVNEPDTDSPWHEVSIQQVRVLEPGKWATYRKVKEEWVPYEEGTTTLADVPFVPFYGARTGFMSAKPPLLEVAHLNVKHWQSQSDQDTILHVARVPILTARQVGDGFQLKVGASAAVDLGNGPDAELKYVEHTGASIGAGKQSLDDLKEEMRQAGAELLVLQPGTVTATQVATENAVGMCALNRIVLDAQDSINLALQYTADWVGLPEGGHVELFNDFGAATLAEASAQLLVTWNQAGKLSDETTFAELKRRGIISAEREWEDEKARIEAQGPALGMMGTNDPVADQQA